MIRYPSHTTRKSRPSKARDTPAASTSTPAIWTSVTTRYGTSSLSYAEANHEKFIQAHHTEKNTIA
ncbi:hypothetical protein a10_04178 [Streptomyces acidiscabies]|nr:hypothetical protein a10_04178 [Streptomyces acidiscabies]